MIILIMPKSGSELGFHRKRSPWAVVKDHEEEVEVENTGLC